jgi:hypothetical protein
MTDNPLRAWALRHQRGRRTGRVSRPLRFSSTRCGAGVSPAGGRGRRAVTFGWAYWCGDRFGHWKQGAGVVERHDVVAEQAPSLFGMRRPDAGRLAIRCARGRAGRLMLAH